MKVIVFANDTQWNELTNNRTGIDWQKVDDYNDFNKYTDADAFFCLLQGFDVTAFKNLNKPVIINSTINSLNALKAPSNVLRINGWTTFLNRQTWEIAGKLNEQTIALFNRLNIKIQNVADEPGFIAARVIAMIINEAYFALGEDVSSKKEIDIAMKLGTNYPYGPFEWGALIGEENILLLLQKLSETDTRYLPADFLVTEVKNKKA
ncbi:MAG: hypothetical protein IT255_10055 [Chitinophagaceae bacterium]|nr:hypothetical protein [Chitinophagaceae bacterium]